MIQELSKNKITLILLAYPIFYILFGMKRLQVSSILLVMSFAIYLVSYIFIVHIIKKVGIKNYIKKYHRIIKAILFILIIVSFVLMNISNITKPNLTYICLWIYFGLSIGISTYTIEN